VNSIDDDESGEVAILHVGLVFDLSSTRHRSAYLSDLTWTTFAPEAAEQVLIGQTPLSLSRLDSTESLMWANISTWNPRYGACCSPVPKL